MPLSFGQVIGVTGPNNGFQGTVSRFGDRVIAAREFVPFNAANNLNFGDPTILLPNSTGGYFDSVYDAVTHAASNISLVASNFAGFAVREVKTMLSYPSSVAPGTQQVGYYSASQMAEALERGSGVILVTVSNSPVAGSQLYTRVALNAGVPAGTIGDWEVGAPAATDLFTVSATTTEGSTAVTLSSATNTQNGQVVSGAGIAAGTYIVSGGGTVNIVLSQAAQATFATSGNLLTLSNLVALPGVVARTGNLDTNNILEITLKNRVAA